MARATSSLPVPFSPWMRTAVSVGETTWTATYVTPQPRPADPDWTEVRYLAELS